MTRRLLLKGFGARTRIGVGFFVLALLLFGVFGGLAAAEARRESERDAIESLRQLAQRLAERLDGDMAARYEEISHLASIEQMLEVDLDPARWRGLFERLQAGLPQYSWIGITDRQGIVVAASRGLLEGRSVRERPWFDRGLRGPTVGEVHEAELLTALLGRGSDGMPLRFVDVAAPLRPSVGVTGVIAAHLSWQWAEQRRRELLAVVPEGERVEIVLVDRAGHIQLGPRQPGVPADRSVGALARAGLQSWDDGQR